MYDAQVRWRFPSVKKGDGEDARATVSCLPQVNAQCLTEPCDFIGRQRDLEQMPPGLAVFDATGQAFGHVPCPEGTPHAVAASVSTANMKRPFRTRFLSAHESRHLVPGWYEPSRWDEERSGNRWNEQVADKRRTCWILESQSMAHQTSRGELGHNALDCGEHRRFEGDGRVLLRAWHYVQA